MIRSLLLSTVALAGLCGVCAADQQFQGSALSALQARVVAAQSQIAAFRGESIDLLTLAPTATSVDQTGVADTSPAWIAAINLANAKISAGAPACIRVPAGTYRIAATLPPFNGPGCVIGSGRWNTVLKIDPAYSGDLFAWSEAWAGANSAFPYAGTTVALSAQRAGPTIRDLSIVGSRAAVPVQNAIAFRDHVDFAHVSDVDIFYLHGHALYTGVTLSASSAYTRESKIQLRAFGSGAPGVAVVDIGTTAGGGDGSNEIGLDLDIYAPYDRGLWVHGPYTRDIFGDHIRIEGIENNPAGVAADLLTIGDPTLPGTNSDIDLRGLELIDPYAGYAAARVTGTNGDAMYDIRLDGWIGGGAPAGKGLVIESGHDSRYRFSRIGTDDTNLTITGTAGGGNVFDGFGAERSWTTNISTLNGLGSHFPVFSVAPLSGGIDLQASRQTQAQTASGAGSTTLGTSNTASGANATAIGAQNTASGNSAVASGNSNIASGDFSTATGQANTASGPSSTTTGYGNAASGGSAFAAGYGNKATGLGGFMAGVGGDDRGRPFFQGYGASNIGVQSGAMTLSATASAATEVSLRGYGGSCDTIPDGTAYGVRVSMVARDVTAPANSFALVASGVLSRANGAASTVYAGSAGTPSGNGTGANAAGRVAQDTTGGCLYVAFTPPAGNTDAWHVGATVETVEVQ